MILFTTIMIVWYAIFQILNGLTISTHNEQPSEKLSEKQIGEAKTAFGCLMSIVALPYVLAHFIYLLYFLKYNPFTYVTYGMLVLMGIGFIRAIIIITMNKIRNKKPKFKHTVFGYIKFILTTLFYAYALYVLIVGF